MKILRKVFNIVINVLIVFVLIISVLVAALALTSKDSGISHILGYAPISVQSNSMVPTFAKGDLIISKMIDENTRQFVITPYGSKYEDLCERVL